MAGTCTLADTRPADLFKFTLFQFFMNRISIVSIALLFLFSVISACSTDSGFNIPEPTFDNVPDPFDISEAEEEPVSDGITKFVKEEGEGEDQVVIRDNVAMWLTLRNSEGTIIYSTYQDGNTSSVPFSLQDIVTNRSGNPIFNFNETRAFTDGLRKGLIGMKEGEKRVLIVPPEQGFSDIPSGSINGEFRDDTLRYDIELDFIF